MFFQFCIVAFLILLLLRTLWIQHRQLSRLKQSNLPIVPIPNLLYLFLHKITYTGAEINPKTWMFQYINANSRIYDRERIHAVCIAGNIIVHLHKPEHIEVLMNSHTVLDKGWMYKTLQPWLGNGLITRSREAWKPRRKLLTPAFHFKILENFQTVINKHSFILIQKLQKKLQEPWIDVTRILSHCTLDIIAETAMGVEINAQKEESEYVKAIHRMEELILLRNMYPWYWSQTIFNLTALGREFKHVVNILHSFTRKVITEKKKEMQENFEKEKNADDENSENIYMQSKNRKPFLSLLLHHHLNDGNMTEEEIREEVDTFMFAGHDTTSVGIIWILYNLGLHLDIQEKVYDEIRSIFDEDKVRPVTSDDIKEMKYLDCVIKESLRLTPSVPFIVRESKEDLKLTEKITIPAKAQIFVEIYTLHHDPEYYPNPEIFDPDRFLPENSTGTHPFAFIPFSAGPRNCIGQKFAIMEEKIIITNILRHFTVRSLDHRDKIALSSEIVLRPDKNIRLQFKVR